MKNSSELTVTKAVTQLQSNHQSQPIKIINELDVEKSTLFNVIVSFIEHFSIQQKKLLTRKRISFLSSQKNVNLYTVGPIFYKELIINSGSHSERLSG